MHRSGTSVIARALQVMGVELGNRLMPPFEENNSKGFWEDLDIYALNVEMLHSLKSDWHFLTPIQPSDVDTLCKKGYLQRAVELLREKTAGVKVFGFKDPRAAKLLPFWKEVFAHDQWNVSYSLVIRHPLSVCQSLAKRDGFDFEKSYLLWLEHVISSLVGTEGEKRVLVDYDKLMQTSETEIARMARELQLSINMNELEKFTMEFLDQKLRHTIYQLNDLMLDNASPPLVQEVYSSLLDIATGKLSLDDTVLKNKIAQWSRELSRLRSTLVFVDKLGSRITETTAERDALLIERTQVMHTLTEKEQAVQKLTAEVLEIYQSRWWRWTKPLRRLFILFQQPK